MDLGKLSCNNGNSVEHTFNQRTNLHVVVFRDRRGRFIQEKDEKLEDALFRLFERVFPSSHENETGNEDDD